MCRLCFDKCIRVACDDLWCAGHDYINREKAKYPLHPSVIHAVDAYLNHLMISTGYAGYEWHTSNGKIETCRLLCQTIARQWPHPSINDPAHVGYTRTVEHGDADRQTFCKLGSYIARLLPELPGDRIETIVCQYREGPKIGFSIVTDKGLVAAMFNCTAYSCMHPKGHNWTPETHPYQVYSSRLGWGMAIRTDETGMARARAIVRPDDKTFVRIYGSDCSNTGATRGDDPSLRDYLTQQGYRLVANWNACKLERIPGGREKRIIGPYLDGNIKKIKLDKNDLQSVIITADGNWNADSQDGFIHWVSEDREGMVQCSGGEWDYPANVMDCQGGTYRISDCVYVERRGQFFPISQTRDYNGKLEYKGDVAIVSDSDEGQAYALAEDSIVLTVGGKTRRVLQSAVTIDWEGNYQYTDKMVKLTGGKQKGLAALATQTVTRSDGAIILRKYVGNHKYTVSQEQWSPAVGDIVTMSAYGKTQYWECDSNPYNINGKISYYSCGLVNVTWDDCRSNTYNKKDLDLVESSQQYKRRMAKIAKAAKLEVF